MQSKSGQILLYLHDLFHSKQKNIEATNKAADVGQKDLRKIRYFFLL